MDSIDTLKKKLDEVAAHLKDELGGIRGSRPSPALVEDITVDYYGQQTPIKHVGSISIVPPREVQVQVWDASIVKAVEKAISEKLNLNAASDGNTIHANLPQLTQERKDQLIKAAKALVEDFRIRSRTLRDEAKKEILAMEKEGALTEDDKLNSLERLQKTIDSFNEHVDEMMERKMGEINE